MWICVVLFGAAVALYFLIHLFIQFVSRATVTSIEGFKGTAEVSLLVVRPSGGLDLRPLSRSIHIRIKPFHQTWREKLSVPFSIFASEQAKCSWSSNAGKFDI